MKTALVIGRFQPFHNGHLEAIRKMIKDNGKLLLVIGSAQESRTRKNPFSAKERMEMISACLGKGDLLSNTKIIALDDENNHQR
ncbi:MAG: adenylyltransferase/cytidyltransferase family protein, partial [Candidatus Micrarchaeota archaeon]